MKYSVEKFEKEMSLADFAERFVDVERFMGACKECGNHNMLWSCPPFDFDPQKIWEGYEVIAIYVRKISFLKDMSLQEGLDLLHEEFKLMRADMLELEKNTEGSLMLTSGGCSLCPDEGAQCTRPSGKPCRHPSKMRPSIESVGGDVAAFTKELFGIELLWAKDGKLPDYYSLAAGLLKK